MAPYRFSRCSLLVLVALTSVGCASATDDDTPDDPGTEPTDGEVASTSASDLTVAGTTCTVNPDAYHSLYGPYATSTIGCTRLITVKYTLCLDERVSGVWRSRVCTPWQTWAMSSLSPRREDTVDYVYSARYNTYWRARVVLWTSATGWRTYVSTTDYYH